MTEEDVRAAFDAARFGNAGAVAELLDERPELVHARGEGAITLLHVAAEQGDIPLAELLLDRGAELEAEASWGYTPFEWAAAMASARVAGLLLERGAKRHNLWTASALGRLDLVESCFSGRALRRGVGRVPRPGADLSGWPEDVPYRTGDVLSDAFHIAARNGHVAVAAFLHDLGADIDARGYLGATGLHWAAIRGRREIVHWLVAAGADPNRRDPEFDATPAGWARDGGHTELAVFLESRESKT